MLDDAIGQQAFLMKGGSNCGVERDKTSGAPTLQRIARRTKADTHIGIQLQVIRPYHALPRTDHSWHNFAMGAYNGFEV